MTSCWCYTKIDVVYFKVYMWLTTRASVAYVNVRHVYVCYACQHMSRVLLASCHMKAHVKPWVSGQKFGQHAEESVVLWLYKRWFKSNQKIFDWWQNRGFKGQNMRKTNPKKCQDGGWQWQIQTMVGTSTESNDDMWRLSWVLVGNGLL